MDGYLSKPIKSEEMAKILVQWLPQVSNDATQKEQNDLEKESGDPIRNAEGTDTESSGVSVKDSGARSSLPSDDVGGTSSDCQENFHDWRLMTGEHYPTFLAKIVSQFVEEAGRSIEHVQRAIASGDAQALREAAHGLKGMSGNVGAKHLQHLAMEIENVSQEPSCDLSTVSLSQLESEF